MPVKAPRKKAKAEQKAVVPPKIIIAKAVYNSKLDRFSTDGKNAVFAGRYPSRFLDASLGAANPNFAGPQGTNAGGLLRDPYNSVTKARFEDTMRADKIAQSSLIKKIMFILSRKPTVKFEVGDEYGTAQMQKQALETIASQQEYRNLLVDIKKINRKVMFHQRMIAAEVQKRVFGRAALGLVKKEGLPEDLRVFASKNLMQVYMDTDTWRFTGVDYYDGIVPKQKFDASELIYLTHLDFNITPDTLFYGLSEFEGIAHDSETNRIISEEDNKEIAKSNWAPKYILPVPSVATQAQADDIANALDPSRINVLSVDVGQPVVFETGGSGAQVNTIREANDRRIIRSIDVPQPTMGYESVTNRSTMDTVMQVYHSTVLDFERLIIKSQIEPQWYDSLTMLLLSIKDIEEAKARVVMDFEDLVFETWADKKDVIFGLYDRGLLTAERMLKQFGVDDAIEELPLAKQENAPIATGPTPSELANEQIQQKQQSALSASIEQERQLHLKKIALVEMARKKMEALR